MEAQLPESMDALVFKGGAQNCMYVTLSSMAVQLPTAPAAAAGKCNIAFERVPAPRLEQPGDAIVRIELCGLCGSDLVRTRGDSNEAWQGPSMAPPLRGGHG